MLYASTSLEGDSGFQLLGKAIEALLSSADGNTKPDVLWSLQYGQHFGPSATTLPPKPSTADERILEFPASSLDLTFDDSILDRVRDVWQKIVGDVAGEFLVFEDREGYGGDDEE